jgi:hypothetical protein
MTDTFTLTFDGGIASEGRLDLYDSSVSLRGLARVLQILGEYYSTGRIIHQAPSSSVNVFIVPPEQGSFRQTVIASVVSTIIAAPFGVFASRVIDSWLPSENPQMSEVIKLLKQQNELLLKKEGLAADPQPAEVQQERNIHSHIEQNKQKLEVIRSVLASSTKDIFRPVGRSADYVAISEGRHRRPIAVVDADAVARLDSEKFDDNLSYITGVVNSFSRGSKTGVIFSDDLGRGTLFSFESPEKLPPGDDFSWSQYTRNPIRITGKVVRWFDGSIKRFVAYNCERIS